jgi:hypothetical protein
MNQKGKIAKGLEGLEDLFLILQDLQVEKAVSDPLWVYERRLLLFSCKIGPFLQELNFVVIQTCLFLGTSA